MHREGARFLAPDSLARDAQSVLLRILGLLTFVGVLVLGAGCGSHACTSDFRPGFSVHVVDLKTKANLPQVDLTFEHDGATSTGSTDENGYYQSLYNVDSGDWLVTVSALGYRSQKVSFVVADNGSCQNRGPNPLEVGVAP